MEKLKVSGKLCIYAIYTLLIEKLLSRYRFEEQCRGSLHIHLLLWLENENGDSIMVTDNENNSLIENHPTLWACAVKPEGVLQLSFI